MNSQNVNFLSPVFERLSLRLAEGSLAHGLLFRFEASQEALATTDTAQFVRTVLCEDLSVKSPRACGRCESCRLLSGPVDTWTHPDATVLSPEPGKSYNMDQVRPLTAILHRAKSVSPRRVAWIQEAERLSTGTGAFAGNSILKLLEEPRPDTIWILTTSEPEKLLPTILSRVQQFRWKGHKSSALEQRAESALNVDPAWNTFLERWAHQRGEADKNNQTRLALPPDSESYWKNREEALLELKTLQKALWAKLMEESQLQSTAVQWRHVELMEEWGKCLTALQAHGNGPLHWMRFRARVRDWI